jgi:serine/threonine protein kinase
MSPQPTGANHPDAEVTLTTEASQSAAGAVIDSYRMLQPIGQGGMGEVWLAEQMHPVRRRVAIKLIKAGMDTREVVARFETERQALAMMDHPAIAKVFDAGSTPQGRPYFVMEYVVGVPITDYCDKLKLTTRQRLELFIRVCEAVQHAHQKAIIHRDLKPSNILVGEVDGKPLPRIIDFGLAKATSYRLTAETMFTRVGAPVGTLGYMSPEQADSTGIDVDTRTDVYSLGVVLYRLLVGALPLDFHNLAFGEILRRLREDDAPRPSARLRTLGEQSSVTAQNRGSDPAALARQLRGDLDAITLKALEKERSRRYASPSDLAADIGRYLRHEPVIARPAGTGYRVRKYIRRHRLGVAVAASAMVLLVSFAVVQALQLRRITRERDRADRITSFMTDMFKVSDPSAARGNSITAREILDKASKEIDPGLSKDPELQAQMMQVMGEVYRQLGLYPQAESLVTRAVDIQRRLLGPENPETLKSLNSLAVILYREGHFTEAEKLNRQTLDIRRRHLGPEHPDTVVSMSNLALNLWRLGRYADAENLTRQTLDIRRRILGPEHPDTLALMSNLGMILTDEARFPEAEKLLRETLEIKRRVLGPEHPDTLRPMNNLANVLRRESRFAESEQLDREALETQRRVLGPEHPETLQSMQNLAIDLRRERRNDDAEKLYLETLEIKRHVLGPEHPDTLSTMNNLGGVLVSDGRYAEAEKLYRQTLEPERRVLGPTHPQTLATMTNLGIVFFKEGHNVEADKLLREALENERRVLGPDHPDVAASSYMLAAINLGMGKRDEALARLQEAVDHGLEPAIDLFIEKNPDFKSLHGDPRFDALVAHAKERAAAVPKAK